MGVSRIARSFLFLLGFIVALGAIGLGVYALWQSRDSAKDLWGRVDKPDLKKYVDEAAEVVKSIQAKSELSDIERQLDKLKEKLNQFGKDAGPALKKRLDAMRDSLESAAESFKRRAKDFPERLAEVAEEHGQDLRRSTVTQKSNDFVFDIVE